MRKKIFGLGLLAAGFMLTITLTGCPNGNDDNNIGGPENQGGLTGLLVTNAPVAAMQVGGTVNLGLTRTPADAPVPGGIHWETSPAIAGEWITLNNATINGVTVTAAAGTANVGAIANANAEGRVAVRATFGTGSGRVESPWVQIEVAAAPLLGSLSFQDVGAAIPVQPNSTRSLVLVLEPANAIPGDITWYPLQGDNPDVWVMPADNGLSATLHAGPNPTDGSVSVTASSDVVGSTAATVAVTVQAGASLVVFQQANVGPNATQAWPAPRG
ncbi:MAG: hypothetical protein FWB78_12260, partial [Treponema sp.]|nr:hypothetical protein [Treponema sp.]